MKLEVGFTCESIFSVNFIYAFLYYMMLSLFKVSLRCNVNVECRSSTKLLEFKEGVENGVAMLVAKKTFNFRRKKHCR